MRLGPIVASFLRLYSLRDDSVRSEFAEDLRNLEARLLFQDEKEEELLDAIEPAILEAMKGRGRG